MSHKLQPGDRVLVETRSSDVYEGTIEHVSPRSMELYDIFCQTTSSPYSGNLLFFPNEIVTVTRVTNKSDVPATDNDLSKKITMDPDEFNRLRQMTFDYVFVDSFGKQFDSAVEVLINRESVAVVGLTNGFTRSKGLNLLLIADFKQVYIFDLFCLVELRCIADILESTFITKVVYDGGALYDTLYHRYKVEMNNVFDIKIIDDKITKENTNKNISECLTHHFNFPPSFLSAAIDDMTDNAWLERPIIKSNKIKAAQLVVYLLSLRDKLMSHILQPYSDATQHEYVKIRNRKDTDLLKFNHC